MKEALLMVFAIAAFVCVGGGISYGIVGIDKYRYLTEPRQVIVANGYLFKTDSKSCEFGVLYHTTQKTHDKLTDISGKPIKCHTVVMTGQASGIPYR